MDQRGFFDADQDATSRDSAPIPFSVARLQAWSRLATARIDMVPAQMDYAASA